MALHELIENGWPALLQFVLHLSQHELSEALIFREGFGHVDFTVTALISLLLLLRIGDFGDLGDFVEVLLLSWCSDFSLFEGL